MHYFTQYNKDNSTGQAQEILCGIEDQYGFLPNMFSYMIESPIAVQAYLQLNQLTQRISLSEQETELAMLAVSKENQCDFCSTAHKLRAIKSGVNIDTVNALIEERPIENLQDAALVSLLQALVRKRGFINEEETQDFLAAGYNKQQIFECILIITLKTLATYSNHLTKPEVNPELMNIN